MRGPAGAGDDCGVLLCEAQRTQQMVGGESLFFCFVRARDQCFCLRTCDMMTRQA